MADLTDKIKELDACFNECLARAGGAISPNDPEDSGFYLAKAIKLKDRIDKIHYAMFHKGSAVFTQLSTNFETVLADEKARLAKIESVVAALKTTLDIVSFIDDCLVVAAGLSKSL